MVMVGARHFLVSGAAIAEIMPRQDACLFKQPDSPIDGSDADSRIDSGGSPIDLLYVGMIDGFRQHPGNYPTLLSHLQTLVEAELLQPRDHRVSIVAWLIHRYHTRMQAESLCPEPRRPRGARPYHDRGASARI